MALKCIIFYTFYELYTNSRHENTHKTVCFIIWPTVWELWIVHTYTYAYTAIHILHNITHIKLMVFYKCTHNDLAESRLIYAGTIKIIDYINTIYTIVYIYTYI